MYSVHWLTDSYCQSKHLTAKFHYLQIPPINLLLLISIIYKFRTFYVYRQIPLLTHSTHVTFTAKCNYLQIPMTAKNLTLPSRSNTCKFQRQPIYGQNPLLAHSITYKFIQPILTFSQVIYYIMLLYRTTWFSLHIHISKGWGNVYRNIHPGLIVCLDMLRTKAICQTETVQNVNTMSTWTWNIIGSNKAIKQ